MNRRALLLALPTIPLVASCGPKYNQDAFGPIEEPIAPADKYHLAQCVFHEARSEGPEGWDAVVEVILNRVADRRWPNSIQEVIYQPYQFSWTLNSVSEAQRALLSEAKTFEHIQAHLETYSDSGSVSGANHYYADYIEPPSWADPKRFIKQIGAHLFYRL